MDQRRVISSRRQATRLLLITLSACTHAEAARRLPVTSSAADTRTSVAPVPDAVVSPAAAGGEAPIGAFMADHSLLTSFARDCVIAGDIESLREPLLALADSQYESVAPGGWVQGVAELQEAARLTARASTLETAAAGVAAMGRICGDCHKTQGAGPELEPFGVQNNYDDQPDSLAQRMYRHMWGAEQLWRGLTTPSSEAWRAGAWAIGHAPEPADVDLPSSFSAALAAVRELGAQASELQTGEQRADLYGLLLSTCADCHARAMDHDL